MGLICFLLEWWYMGDKKAKDATVGQKLTEAAPDALEPVLDEASEQLSRELFGAAMPELIKDLPILKYVKTASDVYTTFRMYKLKKRMTRFLHSLLDGGFQVADYEALGSEEKQLIIDILVTELDAQTDDMQSEALALLFMSYINGSIDRLMFHGISHELKNTNPLVFYFSVDGFTLHTMKGGVRIEGPLHYLPASFYANFSESFAFSTDNLLTNLGQAFFTHIYEPMRINHSI